MRLNIWEEGGERIQSKWAQENEIFNEKDALIPMYCLYNILSVLEHYIFKKIHLQLSQGQQVADNVGSVITAWQ